MHSDAQERKTSFWIKGGLVKNYNYGSIVQRTVKPMKLTAHEGDIVNNFGIEIRHNKYLFSFDGMKADLGRYGSVFHYDDNDDNFVKGYKWFEDSDFYWVFSFQSAYRIWENDYISIYPKIGYQFQYLDFYSFDRKRNWNFSTLPQYEKRTCYSRNGHNIIGGIDLHIKFIPQIKRGNYFISVTYAKGLMKIFDAHFGFDGLDKEKFIIYDENTTIRRLSDGLFLQLGYKFNIY
jgi:hypothetical protein